MTPGTPGPDRVVPLTDLQLGMESSRQSLAEYSQQAVIRMLLALRSRLAALERERDDALNVKTKEGLTCSEWIARTGKAERERDRARSNYIELQRHRDAWRGYAYGRRDRPTDFLDGNMVESDRGPTCVERAESAEALLREAREWIDEHEVVARIDAHLAREET